MFIDNFDTNDSLLNYNITTANTITYKIEENRIKFSGSVWCGASFVYKRNFNKTMLNKISFKIDFLANSNHYSSASVPYICFGNPTSILRDAHYNMRTDGKCIALKFGTNNEYTIGSLQFDYGLDLSQSTYTKKIPTSYSLKNNATVKLELDFVNNVINIYYNDMQNPILIYEVTDNFATLIDSDNNFCAEFNYNSYGSYDFSFSNIVIDELYKGYFLVKNDNNKIYSYNGTNFMESQSQIMNTENFKNNGFNNLNIITEEQWNDAFPDKTGLQLLMYTEDTTIMNLTIEYNVPEYIPIDKLDNQFEVRMMT